MRNGSPQVLLLVEDTALRGMLSASLQAEGYTVLEAASASRGVALAADRRIELLVVDLDVSDRDGLELLEDLGTRTARPILVLSARAEEPRKVQALDLGADDYLAKPFGMAEMLARLRVARRRAAQAVAPERPVLLLGDVRIDLEAKTVQRGAQAVRLTATEWRLLEALARRCDHVVSSHQLLREVWGPGYGGQGHYLRIYMRQLRRKLEQEPAAPRHLLTEAGIGYRLRVHLPAA